MKKFICICGSLFFLLCFNINLPAQNDSITAQKYFERGKLSVKNKKFNIGIEQFDTAENLAGKTKNLRFIETINYDIGLFLCKNRRVDLSFKYWVKALQVRKLLYGEQSVKVGNHYINLAINYRIINEPTIALNYLDSARTMLDSLNQFSFYNTKANIYSQISNYNQAINQYHNAEKFATTSGQKGYLYHNLGSTYFKIGQYHSVIDYSRKALNFRRDSVRKIESYELIGKSYLELNDYENAEKYYQKGLNLAEKTLNPRKKIFIGGIYLGLNVISRNNSNYKLAQQYIDSAKNHIVFPIQKASVLRHQGILYREQEDYKKALSIFLKMLELEKKIKKSNSEKEYKVSYLNIANVYMKLEKYDSSLYYIQKVCTDKVVVGSDMNIKKNPPVNKITDLNGLKVLHLKADNLINSKKYDANTIVSSFLLCDSVITNLSAYFINSKDKLKLASLAARIYSDAILYLNQQPDSIYKHLAFYFAERNHASLLNAELVKAKITSFSGISSGLLTRQRDLKAWHNYFNAKLIDNHYKNDYQRYKDSIFEINKKLERLQKKLYEQNPSLKRLSLPVVTVPQLQNILSPTQAVMEYNIGNENIHIFVVTNNTYQIITLPKPAEFNTLTRNFKAGILNNEPQTAGQQLYALLISQAKPHLKNIKSLLLIPYGKLYNLPLHAMKKPATDTFLIQEFACTYYFSSTLWHYYHTQKATTAQRPYDFIGMAPFYKSEEPEILTKAQIIKRSNPNVNLPKSKQELIDAAKNIVHSGDATIYTSENATEKQFREHARNARIIHLSTHSRSFALKPEKSHISFAETDQLVPENDGKLYLSEIYNLSHRNCDLLVLSSCESGGGKIYAGEGLYNIPRAFLFAGAQNTVHSLWDLSDPKTYQFMLWFYKALKSNTYPQALQEAMKKMIAADEIPVDWAGFVYYGL